MATPAGGRGRGREAPPGRPRAGEVGRRRCDNGPAGPDRRQASPAPTSRGAPGRQARQTANVSAGQPKSGHTAPAASIIRTHRPTRAVEPPPSRWVFPDDPARLAAAAGGGEVVGIGADLEPGTLLAAYRSGLFPMPARRKLMAWWSPDPRGILPLQSDRGLRVSRSLRKSCARFEIRVNTAFDEVLEACADRRRPGAWIDRDIRRAYRRLHDLGWVHSVEAWDEQGRLAGGLYGVAVGGLFAGESMFYRRTDASKAALVGLASLLRASPTSAGDGGRGRLLDVQWATPHLLSLGAIQVSRVGYHELLARALGEPQPAVFGGGE
jgi:leucyl/phenylalanyl-tRNA--protein transferase